MLKIPCTELHLQFRSLAEVCKSSLLPFGFGPIYSIQNGAHPIRPCWGLAPSKLATRRRAVPRFDRNKLEPTASPLYFASPARHNPDTHDIVQLLLDHDVMCKCSQGKYLEPWLPNCWSNMMTRNRQASVNAFYHAPLKGGDLGKTICCSTWRQYLELINDSSFLQIFVAAATDEMSRRSMKKGIITKAPVLQLYGSHRQAD